VSKRPRIAMGLYLSLAIIALAGCQPPMVRLDTLDGIGRATLIDSAIAWDAPGQEIDVAIDQQDDGALSMTQATMLAVKNSPELAAALWKVRVAQADAQQERLLPNPILALTVRIVAAGGKPALEASLAEDLLSLLRRGRKITAADEKLRAASAAALTQAIDIVAQTQQQYLETAIVDEELAILEERRKLLDRVLTITRTRLKAGEGTALDTTTVEAQRIELQADEEDRQAERVQQRLTLARMVGRPRGRIDWKLDSPTTAADILGTERQWIDTALASRPELESKRWELAALGEEEALAKWSVYDGADVAVMSQRDPDWQVGPSITTPLPIFDNGQAKQGKAAAERMTAVHEWVATRRQVVEEVRKAHAALSAARAAAAKIGNELLPLQEKRRAQAEAAYKAGESDLTTLLLAQDSLATSRAKWVELREKAAVAGVKLERAVGGKGVAAKVGATQPTTRPD
jgi:cobalt-zinc-cadmium efflux system outer membrane protein